MNAQTWLPLGAGLHPGISSECQAITIFNGNLYAAGNFDSAGGIAANNIAEWNGTEWLPLGTGFANNSYFYSVYALAGYNGNLYAGGYFDTVEGAAAANIARWNDSTWSTLGDGITGHGYFVAALTVYNGNLIVGGLFDTAGGMPAQSVAQWDGASWATMGSGLPGVARVFDVYQGVLYAGGQFIENTGSGAQTYGLASWNGSSWTLLAPLNYEGEVYTLSLYENSLYAGGSFDSIGGIAASDIAQWNVVTWSSAGTGISTTNGSVNAMAAYKGDLYVGGSFRSAGGSAYTNMAIWNGSAWASAGGSFSRPNNNVSFVSALLTDSGNLYACGLFTQAGGVAVNSIAELTDATGLTEIKTNTAISIFPNPSNGKFSISLQNVTTKYIINIYNATGNRIAQTPLNPGNMQIDLNGAAKGVYFYRVISEEGEAFATGELLLQ